MKTIIVCGGRGIRLSEETEYKPKPMVKVGSYPILLHIMNIYAHYGHKDFILCLGYKGDMIKDYFLTLSRYYEDFDYDMKTGVVRSLDKHQNYDYKVTFLETGEDTNTSGRILQAMKYIDEEHFMVTYGDGVSTIDINKLIEFHLDQEKKYDIYATISGVHPHSKYGRVWFDKNFMVTDFEEKKPILDDYINGGFHVYNKKALPLLREEEMLENSLIRICEEKKLALYKHDGFWHCMDTMKDYMSLNEYWETGKAPWAVWENPKK